MVLEKRGYTFESETDTEAVAVLCKYIWDSQPTKRLTFNTLIKAVIKELEGSFAFVFKSIHFPSEIVMARRGSPLLIGVKTDKKLKVDFVDVEVAPDSDKLETSEWGSRMRGRKRVSEALTLVLLPPPQSQQRRRQPCPPRPSDLGQQRQPAPDPVAGVPLGRRYASADRVLHRLGRLCRRRAHQARPLPRGRRHRSHRRGRCVDVDATRSVSAVLRASS